MTTLDPRDVCQRQHELYLEHRDRHRARSVGPDGAAHEVDVLRLLCLSGMDGCDLRRARYCSDTREVAATQDIAAGDIITFYPGDSAQYWPPGASAAVSLRLCSDRVRARVGEWHPASKHEMHDAGDGFYIAGHPDFADDGNYLGHVIRETSDDCTNAVLAVYRGIALPVVATRDIVMGEEILL